MKIQRQLSSTKIIDTKIAKTYFCELFGVRGQPQEAL